MRRMTEIGFGRGHILKPKRRMIELFVVERIGASEFGKLSHEQKQHEVYAGRLLSVKTVKVLYCRYVQGKIISIAGADVYLLQQ